jgi:hypothetical protein
MANLPFEEKVSSKYGAPMGRRSDLSRLTEDKLHLRKVPLDDGGYDPGRAYWGSPANLWCAWNDEGEVCYVRADDRIWAKVEFPRATFYR